MKLIRNLAELTDEFQGGALSIGNFDGVHRGHVRLVESLVQRAQRCQGPAVVFTFDPHPVRVLRPSLAPPPLTWTDRKAELLSDLGATNVISYPTDNKLLSLSPREFFQQIVVDQLNAQVLLEGPNFFFGRDRKGNIDLLRKLCVEHGIDLEIVQPVQDGDQYISSSRVRSAISSGDMATAVQQLTRPYRIRGMVTHGAHRGASIGFPTANLGAIDTLIPAHAVYAGAAWSDDLSWPAAIHVGPNPTFGETDAKVEVHLIGFQGFLYGQPLEVDFHTKLRDIYAFASLDELKRQLSRDVATAVRLVANT